MWWKKVTQAPWWAGCPDAISLCSTMSVLPGSHLQKPLSSCSMVTKRPGKFTGARNMQKALSSEICPFAAAGLVVGRHIQVRKVNLLTGQHQGQLEGSSSYSSPPATFPCGGGSCVLWHPLYELCSEKVEPSQQELALCTSPSGWVLCSPHVSYFTENRGGERKALLIYKLWVNFPLGGRTWVAS